MSLDGEHGVIVTLLSIKAQNEGSEVALTFCIEAGGHSEKRRLVISTEQYCEKKPMKGRVTQDDYESLELAAQVYSAVRRGEGLLSYGSNSARALAHKLTQRGYARELAEEAAAILVAKGLINEQKDLLREVERCLGKLWGASRIRAHLWSKGYGEAARNCLEDLFEEVDFVENCQKLIQKRYGEPPCEREEIRRMTVALARYGYSIQEIREAITGLRNHI